MATRYTSDLDQRGMQELRAHSESFRDHADSMGRFRSRGIRGFFRLLERARRVAGTPARFRVRSRLLSSIHIRFGSGFPIALRRTPRLGASSRTQFITPAHRPSMRRHCPTLFTPEHRRHLSPLSPFVRRSANVAIRLPRPASRHFTATVVNLSSRQLFTAKRKPFPDRLDVFVYRSNVN